MPPGSGGASFSIRNLKMVVAVTSTLASRVHTDDKGQLLPSSLPGGNGGSVSSCIQGLDVTCNT